MIAFIFLPYLPPPGRQHFRGKFFRCPIHSKSAPRNRCPPPPTFLSFLRPCVIGTCLSSCCTIL
jgi:hypothetical protein